MYGCVSQRPPHHSSILLRKLDTELLCMAVWVCKWLILLLFNPQGCGYTFSVYLHHLCSSNLSFSPPTCSNKSIHSLIKFVWIALGCFVSDFPCLPQLWSTLSFFCQANKYTSFPNQVVFFGFSLEAQDIMESPLWEKLCSHGVHWFHPVRKQQKWPKSVSVQLPLWYKT